MTIVKKKRRTVGPVEFKREKLPEIPTYDDEVDLINQVKNYPCNGVNKIKIHAITKTNGTFLIQLELMLDSEVVGNWNFTCVGF